MGGIKGENRTQMCRQNFAETSLVLPAKGKRDKPYLIKRIKSPWKAHITREACGPSLVAAEMTQCQDVIGQIQTS